MELLCLLSSFLSLLRDSTSKSLLQFFIQDYPRSRALILEKATETKEKIKIQKSLGDEPGHIEEGPPHGTSGQAAEAHFLNESTFSHLCAPFPALVAPGTNTALPVHLASCVLQHTFEGHFLLTVQMMILFIFIIILACVTPTVVNGAIQSLQIRHAIYLNIAVNLTGCIYSVCKMFFCSVLNLLPFKLIKSFCSHLQQLLKSMFKYSSLNCM